MKGIRVALGVPFVATVAAYIIENIDKKNITALTVWLPNQKTRAALTKELAEKGVKLLPQLRLLRAEDPDITAPAPHQLSHAGLCATVVQVVQNGAAVSMSGSLVSLFNQKVSMSDAGVSVGSPFIEKTFAEMEAALHHTGLTHPAAATREALLNAATDMSGPNMVAGILDAHGVALDLLRAMAAREDSIFIYPDLPLDAAPTLASHPGAALARLFGHLGIEPAQMVLIGKKVAPAIPVLLEAPSALAEAAAVRLVAQQALNDGATPIHILCPDVGLRHLIRGELQAHGLVPQGEGLAVAATPAGQLFNALAQAATLPDATTLSALSAALQLSPWLDAALWRGVAGENWHDWATKLAALDKDGLPPVHRPQVQHDFELLRNVLEPLGDARPLPEWLSDMPAALETMAPRWADLPGGATLVRWLHDLRQVPFGREWSATLWADFVATQLPQVGLPLIENNCPVLLTGLLEARLLHAGTVIIAGANEGIWPAAPHAPLLGDAECERLGLSGPRQQVRLTAAELYLALHAAPRVFISRSVAEAKGPTRPSRFLQNIASTPGHRYIAAAQACEAEPAPLNHAGVFMPGEKLTAPAWSASFVEDLGQCPYRALGKRRLQLREVPAYSADPTAEHHGLWVHRWLDSFWNNWSGVLNDVKRDEAVVLLSQLGEKELSRQPEIIGHLWRARLPRMAIAVVNQWLIDVAHGRTMAAAEARLEAPLGATKLNARADRIDISADGLWLVDYKTGAPPSWSKVMRGEKPQLLVEAWLAEQKGREVAGVQYVQVRGHGRPLVKPLEKTLAELGDAVAQTGPWLNALAARYGDGKTFPAAPVYGGGLKPRGHCEHCPLGGVCRWADVNGVSGLEGTV